MTLDWKRDLKRVLAILFAALLLAVSIKTFVRAADLFPGGVTGLTVLIQRLCEKFLGFIPDYTPINLALNAFPVYIGFRYVGKKFTLLSLLLIVVSGILTDMLPSYIITYDPLLISVFGGILSGVAVSICLSVDATSGGTDFIAIYLSQKRGVETWNLVLGFNVVILVIAGFFFGWERALYSIIYQFVSTQTLHTLYRSYQKQTQLSEADPLRRHGQGRGGLRGDSRCLQPRRHRVRRRGLLQPPASQDGLFHHLGRRCQAHPDGHPRGRPRSLCQLYPHL